MNYLYFCLLAAFWGGSFIAIQHVVMQLPPYLGAFLRVFFAMIFLMIIFTTMRKPIFAPIKKVWPSWICGLFSIGIPFSFLFWGERFISPGLAAILNGTVPILTFIFATLFSREDEPFSWNKCFGVCLGMFGTGIIFYPKLTLPGHTEELWGAAAVMIMALSYAIGVMLNRINLRTNKISFHTNLVQQHFSSSLFLLFLVLAFEPKPIMSHLLQADVMFSVFYLALFSTALAFMIFFHLIKTWGTVKASMVTYIVPIITIGLDFLFSNVLPKSYEVIGATCILIGVVVSQLNQQTASKEIAAT